MFNMLVGNIDVPGGHLGVPLDHRGFFIHEGEDGVLKPEPHQLHPAPPFKYPPDSTHLMEWFPIGFDAGQLNTETLLEPERFGLNYSPEVMLMYHSNPLWNMPETDKVEKIMARMKFVVAIDIQRTESTEWADVFLPDHTFLESYLLNCLEPPAVTGHSLRQPVVKPVGDTKDAFDILTEIAERIGFRDDWNDLLNIVTGFTANPKYLLDPEKRYSVEEFWDRYARSIYGDEKGLDWFKQHGHAVRYRTPEETYMPYGKLRIPFYFEFIKRTGDEMRQKFERVGMKDWPLDNYQPLPFWKNSQVIEDGKAGYPFYVITFKESLHTFADTVVMPWLSEVSEKEAVHGGILVNPITAEQLGIKTGSRIRLHSPAGSGGKDRAQLERVEWDEVVVSESVKQDLKSLVRLLEDPERTRSLGLEIPVGLLLVGPPGTGKTLIARLIASQTKRSFYPLTAANVLGGGVGDSVKRVSAIFARAKEHSPALIFLDEMDGLLPANNRYLAQHDIQLVEQFLTEISGLQPENNVFLVGTTNHPENIDPRVLRGGRFSEKIQIRLPDADQRAQLLSVYLRGARLEPGLTIGDIAQRLIGMSPADLQAICTAAKRMAFNRLNIGDQLPPLNWSDFEMAVERVRGATIPLDSTDSR